MAVTVMEAPFVVLDEEDRIVGVGPLAASGFGPLHGRVMWDCFPGSEPLFKPYYDQARRIGEPVEFVQYYDGRLVRVRAAPTESGQLELSWELLTQLDTLTIEELVSSVDAVLRHLEDEGADRGRDGTRGFLRLIEGGA